MAVARRIEPGDRSRDVGVFVVDFKRVWGSLPCCLFVGESSGDMYV